MIHYIIYISTAYQLMSSEALSVILKESRRRNSHYEITGMLIYVEGIFASNSQRTISSSTAGRFMQVLEGSRQDVEYIFDLIKNDQRHHNVILIESAPSVNRYFQSWQMGFSKISVNELQVDNGYFNPYNIFSSHNSQDKAHPLTFLRSFYLRGQSQDIGFRSSTR